MSAFFTVTIFDKEFGKKYETLEKEVGKVFPHEGVSGAFGYTAAMIRLKVYSRMVDEPPSVGAFVIEIDLEDGDAIDLIKFIKKSSILKNIPVILYSDSADKVKKEACLSAGAEAAFKRNQTKELIAYLTEIYKKGKW